MIPAGLIPLLPLGVAGAWLTWRAIQRRLTVRKEVKKANEDMARFDEEVQQWLNGKS